MHPAPWFWNMAGEQEQILHFDSRFGGQRCFKIQLMNIFTVDLTSFLFTFSSCSFPSRVFISFFSPLLYDWVFSQSETNQISRPLLINMSLTTRLQNLLWSDKVLSFYSFCYLWFLFIFFLHCIFFFSITFVIFQVLGHKEGLNVMERADPLFLLFGLPAIPLTLICGKLVRWEDYVLKLWRKHSSRFNYFWKGGL